MSAISKRPRTAHYDEAVPSMDMRYTFRSRERITISASLSDSKLPRSLAKSVRSAKPSGSAAPVHASVTRRRLV